MSSALDTILTGGVYAVMVVFTRLGFAIMLLPGFGDLFISMQLRLVLAVGLSFILAPILMPHLPVQPGDVAGLVKLIAGEAMLGAFIGTIGRFFLSALETAGQFISAQTGLAAAMMFNPQMSTQGTVIGTMLTQVGVLLLFITNTHHIFLQALVGSYQFFPVGLIPNTGDMVETITQLTGHVFLLGVQISSPFIIVGMVFYIGLGLLARLMPQMQIFFVSMPIQILVGLFMLAIVMGAAMDFWLQNISSQFVPFLTLKTG